MTKKLDLSIIIVNWNTKELLVGCLNSIFTSRAKVKYEIIIVDNGSDDGSQDAIKKLPAYIEALAGKQNSNISNLRLIENKTNLGFAKANNKGIKETIGKYILLLNSDTKVKPGTIDELVNFAKKASDAGVVGPKLLNIDGTIQPSVFHFPTISRAFREYWLQEKGAFSLYVPKTNHPLLVESVVGAAFLITPAALSTVGILDERYFMYFEDLDYCRKTWQLGLKVYYLPSAKIVHYHGASGKYVVKQVFQWKRLIPSSKIYHGLVKHYLINLIIWSAQKWRKFLKEN